MEKYYLIEVIPDRDLKYTKLRAYFMLRKISLSIMLGANLYEQHRPVIKTIPKVMLNVPSVEINGGSSVV